MKQIIQKTKLFFQIGLTICLSLLLVSINTISAFAETNEGNIDILYLFYDVETDEVVDL